MMMRKLHEIEDTISGEWKYLVENDLCKIEELVKSFANEYRQGGFIVQVPKIVDMRAMLLTALMRDRKQGNESKEETEYYQTLTEIFTSEKKRYIIIYTDDDNPMLVCDVFENGPMAARLNYESSETLEKELVDELRLLPERVDAENLIRLFAKLWALYKLESEKDNYESFQASIINRLMMRMAEERK